MSRISSKKYTGVYLNKLEGGDVSYSIMYKNQSGKMRRVTLGKKSAGITEVYAFNKRSEYINMDRLGEDPISSKKKKQFIFENVWNLYVDNKALSDAIRTDYKGRWKKHMQQDFALDVTMDKLLAFRKRLEGVKRPLSPRSID